MLCTPIDKEKGSILHAKNLNLVYLLQSNSLHYSYHYIYVLQAFFYAVIMCQKDFWIVACSIKMIHNRRYKEQRAKFFLAKTVTTLKKFLFFILNECLKLDVIICWSIVFKLVFYSLRSIELSNWHTSLLCIIPIVI